MVHSCSSTDYISVTCVPLFLIFSALWYIASWHTSERLTINFLHFAWFANKLVIARHFDRFIWRRRSPMSCCWIDCIVVLLQHLLDHSCMRSNISVTNPIFWFAYFRQNCICLVALPWFWNILLCAICLLGKIFL